MKEAIMCLRRYNRNWQWNTSLSYLLKKTSSNYDTDMEIRIDFIWQSSACTLLKINCSPDQFCFKNKNPFHLHTEKFELPSYLILGKERLFKIPVLILASVLDLELVTKCARTGSQETQIFFSSWSQAFL